MNLNQRERLTLIRPRRRRRHRLRGFRELVGAVPFVTVRTLPQHVADDINARIYVRRTVAVLVIAGLLIAFWAGWAAACEPRVDIGPACLLEARIKDGMGDIDVRPEDGRQYAIVTLPAQAYDAYFATRRRPFLFELRINDRWWVRVRARRGEAVEAR